MSTTAATQPNGSHPMFDAQFDILKSTIQKLVDRATTKPTWFGRVVTKTGDTIKAHPIAAVGIAIGVGYAIVRFARR